MKRILQNTLKILNHKERVHFYLFILLNLLISIIDVISLALLVFLIGFYTNGKAGIYSIVHLKWLSDANSILPISIFVVLFIIKSLIGHLIFVAQYKYVYRVASRISRDNLLHYLRGTYADYVHIDSSVQIRKIMQQPVEFCHYVLSGMQQITTELLLSFFSIIAILLFNVKLFFLLTLVLVPPVILIAYFTKRKLKNARADVKSSHEKTIQYLQEALSGYIESNIYDKTLFFTDRYTKYQEKLSQHLSDVQSTQGVPSRIIEIFAVLGLFTLALINKLSVSSSAMEVINIGAFMAAAYKIIPGIGRIAVAGSQIKTYEYTVNDLINTKDTILSEAHHQSILIESIRFHNVLLNYNEKAVHRYVDLNIFKGDFLGINGDSGKGKTTLIHLLLGFLSQDSGDILINDIVVNDAERCQYWSKIAYVPQRPFLIHGTVSDNITLSGDNINKNSLEDALNITGLRALIDSDPAGLNKVITENGKNISGGQRQRIALARAIYQNADLIILDEPFSELDVHSQQLILEQIKTLSVKGKIIIIVTHNKDNLLYCNKTYLIG